MSRRYRGDDGISDLAVLAVIVAIAACFWIGKLLWLLTRETVALWRAKETLPPQTRQLLWLGLALFGLLVALCVGLTVAVPVTASADATVAAWGFFGVSVFGLVTTWWSARTAADPSLLDTHLPLNATGSTRRERGQQGISGTGQLPR